MLNKLKLQIDKHLSTIGVVFVILLVSVLSFALYRYHKIAETQPSLYEEISTLSAEKRELLVALRERQAVIDAFQGEIKSIGTTVGNLKKLSETDEELLKKYSRVYFLNENYTPAHLNLIPEKYLLEKGRELYLHAGVWPFLQMLVDDAKKEGLELTIASAFRSFDTQAALKSNYAFTYGSGSNQFSADQGYSEHQLGTTVDFTTPELGANFSKFSTDPAYEWLLKNAYKYGFTLSYPENNSYYKFEPWHWRFVGRSLALYLHNEKLNFYDVDQRLIDRYLINIFDE